MPEQFVMPPHKRPTDETLSQAGLAAGLTLLRQDPAWMANVTAWYEIAAQKPQWADWPAELDERLTRMLAEQGIVRPYTHQAEAVARVLAGEDIVVVTPTASGKSLCYHVPVLQELLHNPTHRTLYLFPTKALAYDQLTLLQRLLAALGLGKAAASFDGDTPAGDRAGIRRNARLILSNPDMLHTGILPNHYAWREFLSNLHYIVIDEVHAYRGVFGSHVANVLRRLLRICAFYGTHPQFICCSATIANPDELCARLIGRSVGLVERSGAPRSKRELVLVNPPVTNRELGLRRSALQEARGIINTLLNEDVQTVAFTLSRSASELLLAHLRRDALAAGREPEQIRGYRSGYLPSERRAIEAGIRSGAVRCVVATNALELGIDIGGLDAAVLVGYPGTIASAWQQLGRAGRGERLSAGFLVAAPYPLDQYIATHPDYLTGSSPELGLVAPDNRHILLNHLRCAAYELPFRQDEQLAGEETSELLNILAARREVQSAGSTWRWIGQDYPASFSLRTSDSFNVSIIASQGEERQTIGWVDRPSAQFMVYAGAVYVHNGQQYLVDELDWPAAIAYVHPVDVDFYTSVSRTSRVEIQRVAEQDEQPEFSLAWGDVLVTTRVTGYRRIKMSTQETLGWGTVDLPEQQVATTAFWLCLQPELIERLAAEGWWLGEQVSDRGPSWPVQRDLARKRDGYRCTACGAPERPGAQHHVHHIVPFREFGYVAGANDFHLEANRLANLTTLCPACHRQAEQNTAVADTLSSLGRVLANLLPLYLMCDPSDLGVSTDLHAPQTGKPTLFVFDAASGGVGLSQATMECFSRVLTGAQELVESCLCSAGCPSCIGPGSAADSNAKERVLHLIAALRVRQA
ncbi:MAG: DEAD/DEAH box helicase [Chloroflexi bacterium]|nr:DEAD/DEAH box helicase [Chloroflexota bacterium]